MFNLVFIQPSIILIHPLNLKIHKKTVIKKTVCVTHHTKTWWCWIDTGTSQTVIWSNVLISVSFSIACSKQEMPLLQKPQLKINSLKGKCWYLINISRVTMLIGQCHFFMEGHLKLRNCWAIDPKHEKRGEQVWFVTNLSLMFWSF